jgi:predicted nucleotidyltransferase
MAKAEGVAAIEVGLGGIGDIVAIKAKIARGARIAYIVRIVRVVKESVRVLSKERARVLSK